MSSAAGSSLPARPAQAGAAVTGVPAPGNPGRRAGAPVETRDASARRRRSSRPAPGQAGARRARARSRAPSAQGDRRDKHIFSARSHGRAWGV